MIDGVIGSISGVAAIVCSKNLKVWNFSMDHLEGCGKMLANSYTCLKRTINPEWKLFKQSEKIMSIQPYGQGFVSNIPLNYLKSFTNNCSNSEYFFEYHIASRLIYMAFLPTALITRIIDAVIVVFAAPLSIISRDRSPSLDNLAYRTLFALELVKDIFYATTKIFNPWAGNTPNT